MNYYVPDYGAEDDNPIRAAAAAAATSSAFLSRNFSMETEDDFVELLWRKGPVYRDLCRKSPPTPAPTISHADSALPCRSFPAAGGSCPSPTATANELFMEEDEMASWLHYPLANYDDVGGELLDPSREDDRSNRNPSDYRAKEVAVDTRPVVSRESTVVDSSGWPGLGRANGSGSRVSPGAGMEEAGTCEKGVTSSSGVSCERIVKPVHADDRKRKAREEADDSGDGSEDAKFQSDDRKKDVTHRSTLARRTRAAEVHNLSERRRRDRINEKMKALQQLIPWCNKSDKASMLDDAIEYLKSLQLQVQMMSMGCSMAPMMYPGVHQYIPSMGVGMGMGMGNGVGGVGRPLLPFTPVVHGSPMVSVAAAHVGHRLPIQAFHSPPVALNDQLRVHATNQSNLALNLVCQQGPQPVQIPNLRDSYHQYPGLHHLQVPLQKQAAAEPVMNKETSMPEISKC